MHVNRKNCLTVDLIRGSTWSSVTANAEDEAKEELIDPQEDTPEFKWFCKGATISSLAQIIWELKITCFKVANHSFKVLY